jgi:hypothetical protein
VTKEKDDDEDDGDEEMRMKNEHRLADDPTNWWAPDSACVQAMARSAGFDVEAQIAHERGCARLAVRRTGSSPAMDAITAEVSRMSMNVTDEIVT